MKFRPIALAAALAIFLPHAPLGAQDAEKANGQITAAATQSELPPDKEKRICKYMEGTGTRFKKKTCRTAEQWEAMAEASKAALGTMRNQPRGMQDGAE